MKNIPNYMNEKLSDSEFEEKYKDILERLEKETPSVEEPVVKWNNLNTGTENQPCAVENYLKGIPEKDKNKPFMISCPCKKCSPFC